MPSLLKKWFNRQPDLSLSPAQHSIVLKLQEWWRKHSRLEVSVVGDTQIYQSFIVDLQPERQCFLIDELFPAYSAAIRLLGQTVKIAFNERGKSVYLQCQCVEESIYQALPAYAFKIPQHLMQTQRRRGYRVLIADMAHLSEVQFRVMSSDVNGSDMMISGVVKDVSIWGIGILVSNDLRETISDGARLVSKIYVEDFFQSEVDLEVKNVRYDVLTNITILGCVFVSISRQVQTQLHRRIIEIQRLQARSMHDSPIV